LWEGEPGKVERSCRRSLRPTLRYAIRWRSGESACGPSRRPSKSAHDRQVGRLFTNYFSLQPPVEARPGSPGILIGSIPGIKNLGAHVIVSEIGIDMSRFASAAHLISWACICPRNDESAGKRRSNRVRKGGTEPAYIPLGVAPTHVDRREGIAQWASEPGRHRPGPGSS
jgi:hypothetical protein